MAFNAPTADYVKAQAPLLGPFSLKPTDQVRNLLKPNMKYHLALHPEAETFVERTHLLEACRLSPDSTGYKYGHKWKLKIVPPSVLEFL